MQITYMGIFSDILNWILEKIFSPVFKFVANLLSTVLGWIFDKVLGPILEKVLVPLAEKVLGMIFEIFAKVFYRLLVSLFELIDNIQKAFDILIGIRKVAYTPPGAVSPIEDTLINVMFRQPTIGRTLGMVTILGLSLAFIFTIYSVAKSSFDLDFEGRRPVGEVMKSFFKTALSFLLVPLFMIFMINLSGVILTGVTNALNENNLTLGKTLFAITSLDAANDNYREYNVSYEPSKSKDKAKIADIGPNDAIRKPFVDGTKDYADLDEVGRYFKFSRFDYVVGFCASIFLMILLAICLIQFVQRIFELILLYIVSPLFVSIIPLDEGEKFGGWRDMFVAKCFMGFGAAIGMRVYLMIVPLVMGNQIDFSAALRTSSEMNYIMKLLLVLGGAFAIFKSSSMLATLINWRAGDSEAATAGMVGGTIYGYTVSRAVHGISGHVRESLVTHRMDGKSGRGQAFSASLGEGGRMQSFTAGTGGGRMPGLMSGADRGALSFGGNGGMGGKRTLSVGRTSQGRPTVGYAGRHVTLGAGQDGKIKAGENGRLQLDKLNLGVVKTAAGADGAMHVSRINAGPVRMRRGTDGKQHVESVNIKAARFSRGADGGVHLSSLLGRETRLKAGADGRLHISGLNGRGGTNLEFHRKVFPDGDGSAGGLGGASAGMGSTERVGTGNGIGSAAGAGTRSGMGSAAGAGAGSGTGSAAGAGSRTGNRAGGGMAGGTRTESGGVRFKTGPRVGTDRPGPGGSAQRAASPGAAGERRDTPGSGNRLNSARGRRIPRGRIRSNQFRPGNGNSGGRK